MCSWEDFLDLENEEYVVFYLLSGQDSSSSLPPAILGHLSTMGGTPAAQPRAHLSPASLL